MKKVQLILIFAINSLLLLTSCSNYNRISFSKVKKGKDVQIEQVANQLTEENNLAQSESLNPEEQHNINLESVDHLEPSNHEIIVNESTFQKTNLASQQKRNSKVNTLRKNKHIHHELFISKTKKRDTRSLGKKSFILGFVGFFILIGNFMGLVYGVEAIKQSSPKEAGRGFAIAGIILNGLWIAFMIIVVIAFLAM